MAVDNNDEDAKMSFDSHVTDALHVVDPDYMDPDEFDRLMASGEQVQIISSRPKIIRTPYDYDVDKAAKSADIAYDSEWVFSAEQHDEPVDIDVKYNPSIRFNDGTPIFKENTDEEV